MTVRIVFEAEAMKRAKLADMTLADLAERFAQIGVAQDQALLAGETAKFNRLFRQMMDVANELKGREGKAISAVRSSNYSLFPTCKFAFRLRS
jgi:hypothetical protein